MDEVREKDIQTLAQAVVDNCLRWNYYDNGADYWDCNFCCAEMPDNRTGNNQLKNFKHETGCAVLVAKDLLAK